MEEDKPQTLLWTLPDCPYRVTVPAPVINEIRIQAVEAFYSVPRGGVEIGGVFFGVREADSVHIRTHRPIQCQYSTGPSFTLSVSDQLGLSGLLEQAPSDRDLAGMEPLGWYHSHTRSEIFLSPVDLQLYGDFFPERWQIALVVRPANLQPTRAGFFFRDRRGAIKSDAPFQEFKLEPPAFGLAPIHIDIPANDAPSPQLPSPDQEEAAPSSARRSRPKPATAPEPGPGSEPVTVAQSSEPRQMGSIATAIFDEGQTTVNAVGSQTGVAVPSNLAIPRVLSMPQPAREVQLPGFLAQSAPKATRNTNWIWAVLAIVLLCGAGGAVVLKWSTLAQPTDLGLETYDINGAFLIRWDRDSSAIRNATSATLEILDGSENTPIELSRADLSAGGYGYMRRTGHVSVHMKVEGASTAEEYSSFNTVQSITSSQVMLAPESQSALAQALADKEHLKSELIDESVQALELRRQITSLQTQLAQEHSKSGPAPAR